MGLDMYLAVRAEATPEQLIEVVQEAGLLRHWHDKTPQLLGYSEEYPEGLHPIVAYWRKANAIHGWFVRELADGVDECQEIPVSRKRLQDLVDRCQRVLEAPDRARAAETEGLMPTSGFFFGSYDFGEWYDNDLKDTIEQLTKVLRAEGLSSTSLYYRASW